MALIHTFVTHKRPDLDEILTYWMLTRLRADLCAQDVKFMFWTPDAGIAGEVLDGLTRESGHLMVGVGGGALDEHSTLKKDKKRGECAATLAVKEFGLSEDPKLYRLLRYTLGNDQYGIGNPLDLADGIRAGYERFSNPMDTINWALQGIDAFYLQEERFVIARELLEEKAKVYELTVEDGRTFVLAAIESDNYRCGAASRFLGQNILIQRHPTGNTQIHTDRRARLPSLDGVARILRVMELHRKGLPVQASWEDLAREGKLEGCEEWYYMREAENQMLLNGTIKIDNVPTALSLSEVWLAVQMGLAHPPRSVEDILHMYNVA